MLVRSGTQLIKWWFSITEQRTAPALPQLHSRSAETVEVESHGPGVARRWKSHPRRRSAVAVVQAVSKKRARLNCIDHLPSQFDYREIACPVVELSPRIGPSNIRGSRWRR
jgi:hypothetical protein